MKKRKYTRARLEKIAAAPKGGLLANDLAKELIKAREIIDELKAEIAELKRAPRAPKPADTPKTPPKAAVEINLDFMTKILGK